MAKAAPLERYKTHTKRPKTLPAVIDHEERRKRLHSTDISAILMRGEGHRIWLEKTGRIEPFAGNEYTRMGQLLERPLLDLAEDELGQLKRNVTVIAEGIDVPIAATLDAQVKKTGEVVEAKTSGILNPVYGQWGDEGSDEIPPSFLVQTTIQMLCANAEINHLYALLGGRGIVRYNVRRDQELIDFIVEEMARWWYMHVLNGQEPEYIDPLPLEIAKRLKKQPNKIIELDGQEAIVYVDYEAAKSHAAAAEKQADAAKSRLLMLLGDAEMALLPDGRTITYFEQGRKSYTVPETSFRTIRLRKAKE